MLIVAGYLNVAPEDRAAYLASCRAVVELARRTPGCHDFSLAGDPLDTGRVNVFEAWETTDAVEAFRGSGPDETQSSMTISAVIRQYEVESVTDLSG